MNTTNHIRATLAANTPTRLGAIFEISTSTDGAILISRAREAGRLTCTLDRPQQPGDTLLSLHPQNGAPKPAAAAALLSSRLIARALFADQPTSPLTPDTLAKLPWPTINPLFEMQLTVLWGRFEASPAERPALVGAFDRIAAELYHLSIDDLITFERNTPDP